MDNYTYSLVQLDGGLDLINAKPGVKPGTLSDCLNVEIVDRSGYKVIDGYERFDGRVNPITSFGKLRHVRCSGLSDIHLIENVGSSLVIEGSTNVFGTLVYAERTGISNPFIFDIYYQPSTNSLQATYEPTALAQQIAILGETDTLNVTVLPSTVNAEDSVEVYNDHFAQFRDEVESLPDVPIGLHLFRDTTYAVVDETVLHFNSGGTTEILINDTIEDSLGIEAKVIDVVLDSGTWAGGDAVGKLLISPDSVSGFQSGNIDIIRPTVGEIANVATITSGSTEPWAAGLWKALSSEQATEEGGGATVGWNKIDTGLIVGFEDGEIVDGEFPHIDRRTQEVNIEYGTESTDITGTNGVHGGGYVGFTLAGDASTASGTLAAAQQDAPPIVYSTNSADLATVLSAEEVMPAYSRLVFQSSGSDFGYTKRGPRVGMVNINTVGSIPGYGVIKGVEVYLDNVISDAEAAANAIHNSITLDVALFKYDATTPTKLGTSKTTTVTNINGATTGTVDVVLGSSTDLWGNTELSLNDVINANFGTTLRATHTVTGGNNSVGGSVNAIVTIDRIRVKIYYEKQFTRYYFWDGVDDVQADMIDYRLFSGDLTLGNGEGVMQFVNIEPVGTAVRQSIKIGDEIHLAEGGGAGTLVGTVTTVETNSLASLSELQEANSRYQFITANFYGNDEWDAFYGVSGAGRAFSFDDTYFVRIYTQDDDDRDKPRHIAYHHFHLVLGFTSGSVQFSVVGEPENFSGIDGATEMPVGDRVTGLQSLRGTTLGVFCENSIWGIVGTVVDQFSTQVLSPNTGAIEYSVVDIGSPVFCDSRGISTLEQTAAYGDFQGVRLSSNITPWLLPRLRRSSANVQGLVGAIPFRANNQVGYFFKDGTVLTMTLVGGQQEPQFTFRKYYIGMTDLSQTDRFLVPMAWSSQVDNTGLDRIHISHQPDASEVDVALSNFVYEFNRGWSFDGAAIPYYWVTNWNYVESPMAYKNVRKVLLEGLSKGTSTAVIQTAPDLTTDFSTTEIDISLPRNTATELYSDFVPYSNVNSLASRGRNLAFKVSNGDVDLDSPEPSSICQVLILGFTTDGYIVK